jgi:pseudouridine-5'-phosphate glycosidase
MKEVLTILVREGSLTKLGRFDPPFLVAAELILDSTVSFKLLCEECIGIAITV